jgi:hypothetical protein
MADEHRKSRKAQLALALARGVSVAQWARNHEVPKVTAYRWAKDPAVRKAVEAYRRRTIDQAIGMMTNQTTRAAGVIARIATEGESETVRLRACRAIFTDMIKVSRYSGLEARMVEIEEQNKQQEADDATLGNATSPAYGPGSTRAPAQP